MSIRNRSTDEDSIYQGYKNRNATTAPYTPQHRTKRDITCVCSVCMTVPSPPGAPPGTNDTVFLLFFQRHLLKLSSISQSDILRLTSSTPFSKSSPTTGPSSYTKTKRNGQRLNPHHRNPNRRVPLHTPRATSTGTTWRRSGACIHE